MLCIAIAICLLLWAFAGVVVFTYGARAVVTGQRLPAADPRWSASPRAQALGAVARELVLGALTLAAWPLGVVPPRLLHAQGEGSPILLVPGAAMTWTTCLPLASWLRRKLPNPIALMSAVPLSAPPARRVAVLADRVRTLSALADGAPVHVVGLGEGGLALLLAMGNDDSLPVGTTITVAAPLRRPRMGIFRRGGRARYADLEKAPLGVADLVIRSEGDNLVMPDESRPAEGVRQLSMTVDGHLGCWYSPRTWGAIAHLLMVRTYDLSGDAE